MATKRHALPDPSKPVTLKVLADYLDLSPATVSIVLNNSPVARSISSKTQQRVLQAAKRFEYRPNLHARMLRTRLTNTIGVLVPELSEGYFTGVMLGVEETLLQSGYLSFTVSHLGRPDLVDEYPDLLINRAVDGLLLINTALHRRLPIPTVGVSSHVDIPQVTNVLLDHDNAMRPALQHLHDLGHRRIALMKGQPFSLDSTPRWESIHTIAQEIGMTIHPELCLYLEKQEWSPELGYAPVRELLRRTHDFTALVCFNDTSAIGAMRAIEDEGLSCPHDISVIGFDDILIAQYTRPRLTTVRQPLHKMGMTAAELLIKRIQNPGDAAVPSAAVWFSPELIVRESTAAPPAHPKAPSKERTRRA